MTSDEKKNVLVVGSNSSLWAALCESPILQNQNSGINFFAVSSRDIYGLSPELFQFSFSHAVVFSYSRKLEENMKLLRNLRLLVRNVIYISTCSVIAANKGYLYTYPRAKREVEVFARDSNLFECLRILRLGMVEGTFDADSMTGRFKYTSLEMIVREIERSCSNDRTKVSFENLYVSAERPFDSRMEELCFKIYCRMLQWNFVMGVVMRPLDVVFRALGWRWYGYNCLVNYGSDAS